MIALRSPMHALFWKEWRGLRHLRWACIGLGALLPLFFIAGAAMGRSELSPFGKVSVWSTGSILRDVVPGTLGFGLWPFAALILIAQAFAGDRAAGTEPFLLERPVTRRRIWTVRLAASSISVATVVAWTIGVWMLWVLAAGGIGPEGWDGPRSILTLGGGILLLLVPCAALASSMLASPLLALLTAALLAGLPLLLSVGLGGLFPYAGLQGMPIGSLVPWLLIPLYLILSHIASTTGEPAGRGRSARGLGGLVLGVLATLFIFVTSAQALLRREASHPRTGGNISAAPGGDRAIMGDFWVGLWLVNPKTGAILEHYPRPSYEAVWSVDGSMLAVATCAGPLGSQGRCRVSVFDRDGKPSAAPWLASPEEQAFRLAWGRDHIFFRTQGEKGSWALVAFDPRKGTATRMEMKEPLGTWEYAGTLWDGRPAIAKLLPEETLYDPQNPGTAPVKESTFGLYRFDPASGAIEPEPLVVDHGSPWSVRSGGLSPRGRWYRLQAPPSQPQEMVDLQTGDRVPATAGGWPDDPIRWYLQQDGDATGLIESRAGAEPRTVRSWSHAEMKLGSSRDHRYLLIRLSSAPHTGTPGGTPRTEEWLYDSVSGAWTQLSLPSKMQIMGPPGSGGAPCWRTWVGSRTLVLWGLDSPAFEDVDALGTLHHVDGGT